MDSNENRRKSKRLSEKCVNYNEVIHQINDKRNKTKNKSNIKSVKLKENETNVRKSSRNERKPMNGIIEVISERKYGLRKLAPINWKERLDTRHMTTTDKSIHNKSIDKTKPKNSLKIEDKNIPKIKEKKINKSLVKINGKINSKVNYKLSDESIQINNKRHKRRKAIKTCDKVCDQFFDKTNQNKYNLKLEINGEVIDSIEESSDLCLTNANIEQQIQETESEVQQKDEELSDNMSYIQYLELCSENEPKVPSLSLNIIINLLKQSLKTKRRNNKSDPMVKKRLYSCNYDLCDSKKCQNFNH